MSDKKKQQLGMNPSTASARLIKDLLWNSVVESGNDFCYHCGHKMTRETFSIEHKEPWMDSPNPVGLYFDIDNISYSHLKCNVGAARRKISECGTSSAYNRGCRCHLCKAAAAERKRKEYSPEYRKQRYERNGS